LLYRIPQVKEWLVAIFLPQLVELILSYLSFDRARYHLVVSLAQLAHFTKLLVDYPLLIQSVSFAWFD